jgi:hypothetical protein
MIPSYAFHKPLMVRSPGRVNERNFLLDKRRGSTWCTDGSKTKALKLVDVCDYGTRQRETTLALGSTPHYFRLNIYAINLYRPNGTSVPANVLLFGRAVQRLYRCVIPLLKNKWGYWKRNIHILLTVKLWLKCLTAEILIESWDCHQSLIQLVKHNRVQLIWVPRHTGTEGNETTNQLSKTDPLHPPS